MRRYKYVIVGGNMAADAAIAGIRRVDPSGSIGVIGAERHPPYNRPPLSKGLWKGEAIDSIWRRTKHEGVESHLGRTVRALDVQEKFVTDDQGATYAYDRLLLATGGTPKRLSVDSDRIIYYRTVDDYTRLRELADRGRRFAVIGAGFIGAEIAAALAMNQKEVVMLYRGSGIGGRVFPRDLSRFLSDFYRQKGVELRPGDSVAAVEPKGAQIRLKTEAGRELLVDGVVAGLGIEPNTELARGAGLAVEDGIVVDEWLRTSHTDIYAAGDVASFHNPALGKRLRVEHEDNANVMGRAAGEAMAGKGEPYYHLPFFYSDLFELGYEAVGDLDPRLDTVADWKEPYREGVIYYIRPGRVQGVLLWNTWNQVDNARKLIADAGSFSPQDLKGRLPAK